ncbi:hypothetical protein [Gracilimonas mengyeensis]|uniref:Uncharacterized protein n=1 Tax=Gracilimonas mengyeensis TaxID=1302730 RepID=A0A521DFX0_9BACT|nr:hypothetical protein [Gracilimonas mengyeensis]SMO70021.1 hypothetical protein SAMN06265219_10896 [Gracilimonas mengyeensis]
MYLLAITGACVWFHSVFDEGVRCLYMCLLLLSWKLTRQTRIFGMYSNGNQIEARMNGDDKPVKTETDIEQVNKNVLELKDLLTVAQNAINEYTNMKATESNNTLTQEKHRIDTHFKMFWIDRALFMVVISAMIVLGVLDKIPIEIVWGILLITSGYLLRNEVSKRIFSD